MVGIITVLSQLWAENGFRAFQELDVYFLHKIYIVPLWKGALTNCCESDAKFVRLTKKQNWLGELRMSGFGCPKGKDILLLAAE